MRYFEFRQGEWNEHSWSYVIDIQRSMNIKIAIEFERCSNVQSMNGVVRGAHKYKWNIKEGMDYPFRDQMLNDMVYSDTIRSLVGNQILEILGEPDRSNEGYLYYQVAQIRLGLWPLKTKTLVIKLSAERAVEWIKIHE